MDGMTHSMDTLIAEGIGKSYKDGKWFAESI